MAVGEAAVFRARSVSTRVSGMPCCSKNGYPGALFFAAKDCHHHLGANVWAGRDAQAPTEEDAQLLEWTIEFPDAISLGLLAASLARVGWLVEPLDQAGTHPTLLTRDPWGTRLRVSAAHAASRRSSHR